jgi:16S rRNA (uracil1498-N3)-methyltransferase
MNRPPRFVLTDVPAAGGLVRVGGTELHHMRNVMRLGAGATVTLLDERGVEYEGRISRFEPGHAVIEVSGRFAPKSGRSTIALASAIIKGPRMDFMVEKAAELGAIELWPLLCARGIVRIPGTERLARWRRLALAAAKQSLAPRPMQIKPPLTLGDLISALPKDTLAVICTMGARPVWSLIRRSRPRAVLMICGPEGDFDEAERAVAAKAGFILAGLGPNRLRSETAALAALSIAAGALDEPDEEG